MNAVTNVAPIPSAAMLSPVTITAGWVQAAAQALARLVASSWQIVHQFRNILLAAQRELPAERIRGVHDRILRRVQSLITRGQQAGNFRRDLPQQWLITSAYSLMDAAAEDTAAGRLDPADAARLITATLLAAFAPPEAVTVSL